MKKTILMFFVGLLSLSIFLISCDEGKKPNIAFKSGNDYTSADATVGKQDTLMIGITASKAESEDVLKKFNASVSFDGASATTTLDSEDLSGAQGDNFSKDLQIITRNVAGKEKYTFTVTNRDGIIGQVTLTLTVN